MHIYLDSNVFISALNIEFGRQVRPLFLEAQQFFERIAQEKHTLVLSGLFFNEIKRSAFQEKEFILGYFSKLGIVVEELAVPPKVSLQDFHSKGMHFPDSLHAFLALHSGCSCLVTFNRKDFIALEAFIPVLEPTQL